MTDIIDMKYLFYINFSNKKCYNAAIQKYYQNAIDLNDRNTSNCLITDMPENDLKISIHKIWHCKK